MNEPDKGVGMSSFFCGCSGEQKAVNQSQFVTYHRPISKRGGENQDRLVNVSYMNDPNAQAGCGLGSNVQDVDENAATVHLPFADFSALLTHKLLQ